MSTLQTFTKRLAYRLTAIKSNKCGIRKKAEQIAYVINQEEENIETENKKNDLCINEGALQFLAYQQGKIPKTANKQKEWLKSTILTLDSYKVQ